MADNSVNSWEILNFSFRMIYAAHHRIVKVAEFHCSDSRKANPIERKKIFSRTLDNVENFSPSFEQDWENFRVGLDLMRLYCNSDSLGFLSAVCCILNNSQLYLDSAKHFLFINFRHQHSVLLWNVNIPLISLQNTHFPLNWIALVACRLSRELRRKIGAVTCKWVDKLSMSTLDRYCHIVFGISQDNGVAPSTREPSSQFDAVDIEKRINSVLIQEISEQKNVVFWMLNEMKWQFN